MSVKLHEFARDFAVGIVPALDFAYLFMERWKQERDAAGVERDSDELSECLSTIFCLADCYNPEMDRESYELDGSELRNEVERVLRTGSFEPPTDH